MSGAAGVRDSPGTDAPRASVSARVSAWVSCDVSAARPHAMAGIGGAHANAAIAAVERLQRVIAEHVLIVELVGDAGRRGTISLV